MTPTEITTVRKNWGLSKVDFGRVLGLQGPHTNIYRAVHRWEIGEAPISGPASRVIECIQRHPELLGVLCTARRNS